MVGILPAPSTFLLTLSLYILLLAFSSGEPVGGERTGGREGGGTGLMTGMGKQGHYFSSQATQQEEGNLQAFTSQSPVCVGMPRPSPRLGWPQVPPATPIVTPVFPTLVITTIMPVVPSPIWPVSDICNLCLQAYSRLNCLTGTL